MAATLDRRQLILTQLYDILSGLSIPLLGGLDGPATIATGNIVNNRDELPASLVPGMILLDADETAVPLLQLAPGRETRTGPSLMKLSPEIYIVLDVRKPQNTNVSIDLNTARAAILDLVLHDATLLAYVGANGRITYGGCVTDLARNRAVQGQMGLMIDFVYPFIPDEIVGA